MYFDPLKNSKISILKFIKNKEILTNCENIILNKL